LIDFFFFRGSYSTQWAETGFNLCLAMALVRPTTLTHGWQANGVELGRVKRQRRLHIFHMRNQKRESVRPPHWWTVVSGAKEEENLYIWISIESSRVVC
jgi:hypothetical protein